MPPKIEAKDLGIPLPAAPKPDDVNPAINERNPPPPANTAPDLQSMANPQAPVHVEPSVNTATDNPAVSGTVTGNVPVGKGVTAGPQVSGSVPGGPSEAGVQAQAPIGGGAAGKAAVTQSTAPGGGTTATVGVQGSF